MAPGPPRFFVAVPLPAEAKDQLVQSQPSAAPGIRLVGPDELHLTLHFLGEVAPRHNERLRSALASVRAEAFTITIQGVGQFPAEGEPRVLWAGVAMSPPLLTLHASLAAALEATIGFRAEERPYTPHVTLAHLNAPPPLAVIKDLLPRGADLMIPSIHVSRFALYSSVVAKDGRHYHEEAVFGLAERGLSETL